MDMMGKIRRLHFRDRLSFSEIARRTGLSRNTVKKWIKAPEGSQPRYRRGASAGKLAAWHEALIQALRADARRPKHERRSGRALVLSHRPRSLLLRLWLSFSLKADRVAHFSSSFQSSD